MAISYTSNIICNNVSLLEFCQWFASRNNLAKFGKAKYNIL